MEKTNTKQAEELAWEDHLAAAMKGFRKEFHGKLGDFPSADFHKHRRAAGREMLLAFRSLLDKAIEKMEEEPPAPKAAKIKVE
jgi:hypothetical protein